MHRLNRTATRIALVAGAVILATVTVLYLVTDDDPDGGVVGGDSDRAPSEDDATDEPALGPLLRLSQPSPLTECPGLPGTETNYAVEPSLVINPTDPNNLIASWQQDRSYGSRGNVVGYSTDGGDSWDVVVVPGANTCSPGQLGVADAWLTFDGGGTAYLASLGGREGDGSVVTGVIVNKSTDGGRTWSQATDVTEFSVFDDKPAITADPNRSGVVYAAWERSQGDTDCSNSSNCRPVVHFSRSEDGAASWSEPQAVAVPTEDVRQNNARILVLPDGSLRLFYEQKPDAESNDALGVEQQLLMVRSEDGGREWSPPQEILTVHQYHPFTPTEGRFYTLFNEAVTADEDGTVYVVSTHNDDAETSTQSRVELRVSRDGGASWDPPETVASLDGFATLPTVAASRTQGIAVTWYDFAADTASEAGVTLSYRAAIQRVDSDQWTSQAIVDFDVERCGLFSREGLPGPQVPWIGEYFGLVSLTSGRFATALVACAPAADLGLEDILYTTFR